MARRQTLEAIREAEGLIAQYRIRLERVEARMIRLDPAAPFETYTLAPNPIFGRGEITRLAMQVLRTADQPVAIIQITREILAAKGHASPDVQLRRRTRRALNIAMKALEGRGIVKRCGKGAATRWGVT